MSALIRQMPLLVFLFFTALPVGMAAIFVFAALRARRQAAAIRSTPTSNIGMAADGYCEFEGRAEAIGGQLVAAPLTLTPCVWYHARVEQWARPSGKNSPGQWSTVKDYTSSAPFFLRDATGVCTVHPWQAEVTPSDKSQWYGAKATPSDRNPPRIDPLVSAHPMMEVAGASGGRFKYYEERIYADSPLLVLGEFSQGRFDETDDEDEEEGELGDDSADTAAAVEVLDDEAVGPAWADDEVSAKLEKLALETTRARISRGTTRRPFIITTQLQAVHVATSEMGSQAALSMALAFLGVAALMVWARFG